MKKYITTIFLCIFFYDHVINDSKGIFTKKREKERENDSKGISKVLTNEN